MLRFQIFLQVIAQLYSLNLILFHFDHNIEKGGFLRKLLTLFLSNIAKKTAIFALCCEISIAEVKLHSWYEDAAPQFWN